MNGCETVKRCAAALVLAGVCIAGAEPAATSHYWTLGAGSYGAGAGPSDTWSGCTELDKARLGWVYLTFGNPPNPGPETTALLNRFLEINPDLKILVRVWPISNLGHPENRHQATFLDYLYKPGVKDKLLAETARQIRSVLDDISKPENVAGFTFLEELPFHFCDNGLDVSHPDSLPWGVAKYRDAIAGELGADFRWDLQAKQWWGRKFVQVLNEIHAHIKQVSGGKWVFVYLQTNHDTLDWMDAGEDGSRSNVLPFRWADLIRPGVADGFFAYPNGEWIWNRYLALAREHDWLFFSQLSLPGGMRLGGWEETVRLVETRVPQNLGYFLYTVGRDSIGNWNDDPSIPPDDNLLRASIRTHLRQHMARRQVGMDIVKRHLQPEVDLHYDLRRGSDVAYTFTALVRNTRDATWFADPAEAELNQVRVTLALPPGLTVNPRHSPPATVVIPTLKPGEMRTIAWWPQGRGDVTVGETTPITVTVEAAGVEPATRRWTGPHHAIEPRASWEFRRSGESGYFPIVRDRTFTNTVVTLTCLADQATQPAIQLGAAKAVFLGTLLKGETLVIGPGRRALLRSAEHPDGRDVTPRLGGGVLEVAGWNLNPFTYTDLDTPSASAKVRLTFERP